jgi:hypothetical protein
MMNEKQMPPAEAVSPSAWSDTWRTKDRQGKGYLLISLALVPIGLIFALIVSVSEIRKHLKQEPDNKTTNTSSEHP